MKVKDLIKLLVECDMEADVKPYFLIDMENIDTKLPEFECCGSVSDIDADEENNVVFLNAEY